jgi:predicted nucleic acid-binding protein
MTRIYVSDTNIWIDFGNAGLLDELFELPFTMCCTDFVFEEIREADRDALRRRGLMIETLEDEAVARLLTLRTDHNNSSLADVSCYLLAKDTGRPLLTGDGRLRKQANKDGLQVHGALWLLDQLVHHAIIEPARAAAGLQSMLVRGARLPQAECDSRIETWRNSSQG